MDVALANVFSFLKLSTGQRLSVLHQQREVAQARSLPDVVAHIDRAIAHDRYTRELENLWAAPRDQAVYADDVRHTDILADQTLTSVRDIARAQAVGLDPGDPVAVASQRIQEEVFPAGVSAITNLRYVDQVAAMEVVVAKLQAMGPEVALLGLSARLARLAELTAAYRAAVDAHPAALEYASVRGSQSRGHAMLLEITARIVGTFYDEEREDHVEARTELLSPILVQMEIVRALNRARRRAAGAPDLADDDADTGGDSGADPAEGGIDAGGGDAAAVTN